MMLACANVSIPSFNPVNVSKNEILERKCAPEKCDVLGYFGLVFSGGGGAAGGGRRHQGGNSRAGDPELGHHLFISRPDSRTFY